MPCDRLLFISGHKSNSFHNSQRFFPILPHSFQTLFAIVLHTVSTYTTIQHALLFYFICSISIAISVALYAHSVQCHISFGRPVIRPNISMLYFALLCFPLVAERKSERDRKKMTKSASVESEKANAPGNTMVVQLKIIKASLPKNCELLFFLLCYLFYV